MFRGRLMAAFGAVLLCMALLTSTVFASISVVDYVNDIGVNAPVAGGFSAKVSSDEDALLISAAYDKDGVLIGVATSGARVGNTLTTGVLNFASIDGVTVRNYVWNSAQGLKPVSGVQEARKITLDAALIDGSAILVWKDDTPISGKAGYKAIKNGVVLGTTYASNAAKASVSGFAKGDKVRIAAVDTDGNVITASNNITLGENAVTPAESVKADFFPYTATFNPTSKSQLSEAQWDGRLRTTIGEKETGWKLALDRGDHMRYTADALPLTHANGWGSTMPAGNYYDETDGQHDNQGVWMWDDEENAIFTHSYYRLRYNNSSSNSDSNRENLGDAELFLNLGEMFTNGDDILVTFEMKGGLNDFKYAHSGTPSSYTTVSFNSLSSSEWRPITLYISDLAINTATGSKVYADKEGGRGEIRIRGASGGCWFRNFKVVDITKARESGLQYAEIDMSQPIEEFIYDYGNNQRWHYTYNKNYESQIRARGNELFYSEDSISWGSYSSNFYTYDKGDSAYMIDTIGGENALISIRDYADGVTSLSGTSGTASRKMDYGKMKLSVPDGLFKNGGNDLAVRIEIDYMGTLNEFKYVNSEDFASAEAQTYTETSLGDGWIRRVYTITDAHFAASADPGSNVARDYGYKSEKHSNWGDTRASFIVGTNWSYLYIKAIRVMSQDYYDSLGYTEGAYEEFNNNYGKYLNASETQDEVSARNPKIFIAGDSIAQTYDPPESWDTLNAVSKASEYPNMYTNLRYGWGQKLSAFLNDGIDVDNRAKAGTSTKTFANRYNNIVNDVRAGDYVLISFGHNDASNGDRHTTVEEYTANLRSMCTRVMEKGAIPVLITSIPKITGSDRTGDNKATIRPLASDGITDYRAAMLSLANELKIPSYDLATDFYAILDASSDLTSYFSADAKEKDNGYIPETAKLIHLSELGASTVAKLIAQSLKTNPRLDALKAYINADAPITHAPMIWLAGDSTCEITTDNSENGREGWGMEIVNYIKKDKGIVNNKAVGGASSRSFYNNKHVWSSGSKDEQMWGAVMNEGKEGDFVIIQFGHNDTTDDTGITDELIMRYADPDSTAQNASAYRYNLKRYVNEARARGITPIFATSIHRYGDVFEGKEDDIEPYREAMRAVAADMNVPVLEIGPAHLSLLNTYGKTKSQILFDRMDSGSMDRTHLSTTGAIEVAKMVANAILSGAATNADLARLATLIDTSKDLTPRAPQSGDSLR